MPIQPAILYHLTVFTRDLLHHLERTELFANIELRGAASYESGLVFTCFLADGLKTQEEVADILERVWIEAPIRYPEGTKSHEATIVTGPDGTRWGISGDSKMHKVTIMTGRMHMEFAFLGDKMSVSGVVKVLGFKEEI